jgi:hypothetical protein
MKQNWRQEYSEPENNNAYPEGSYWLLKNEVTPDGYTDHSLVFKITADEKWMNCRDACQDCNICRRANPSYQQCWRSCDRCRNCHLRNHRSLRYRDPPYWNAHPYAPNPDLSSGVQSIHVQHPAARFTTTHVCGPVLNQEYIHQYNNYMQCKRCQENDKCWSKYQQKCVDCDEGNLATTCEDKFGCPNPMSPMFGAGPPRDPLFTNCVPCWRTGYTL